MEEGLLLYLTSLLQNSPPRQINQGKYYFYLLSLFTLLNKDPRNLKPHLVNSPLFSPQLGSSRIFQFFVFRLLGDYSNLEEKNLLSYHDLAKPSGGFTLENSALPNIYDTFWIGYLLETYKWMLPVQSGPIYAYIVKEFTNLSQTDTTGRNLSQLVVLLGLIFESLIEDTEKLIFTNMSQSTVLDLQVISVQGGLLGAEKEVLKFLNKRFQFQLDILDNDIRFRRYLNKIDPFREEIAFKIRASIAQFRRTDISTFRREENRLRKRDNRIEDKLCIQLIQDMQDQHFFTGAIYKKARILRTPRFYFQRESYIEKIITSNRPIDYSGILSEKQRLLEVIGDIHSMTHEMEISAHNIMNEIESMIIAGIDPEFIENRLKFNIKKTLFDAAFFNKAIESFTTEFEYYQPHYFLKEYNSRWNAIYSLLQKNFLNLHRILNVKIEKLREEKFQHSLTVDLEKIINKITASLIEQFDQFENLFRSELLENYTRDKVRSLHDQLIALKNKIINQDLKIQNFSLRITSNQKQVRKFRNGVINKWISQNKDFIHAIDYYQKGFDLWLTKIAEIDKNHQEIIKKISETEQIINQKLYAKEHEEALELINETFPKLNQMHERFLKQLKKELNKLYRKNRKLSYLLKNLKSETLAGIVINQKLINHKREEFQENIQLDLQSHLINNLKSNIDQAVNKVREEYISMESVLSQGFQDKRSKSQITFEKRVVEFKKLLKEENIKITQLQKEIHGKYSGDSSKIAEIVQKWIDVHSDLQIDVDNLFTKYQEEKLVEFCITLAKNEHSNHIELEKIAKLIGKPIGFLEERLKTIIQNNRMNAILVGKPLTLEVHNADWRDWQKLLQYTQTHFREIEYQYDKINDYFQQTITRQEFIEKKSQIHQLFDTLSTEIKQSIRNFDKFIKDFNFDNPLIKETAKKFNNEVKTLQKNIESITSLINKVEHLQKLIEDEIAVIDDVINSQIHKISIEIEKKKKSSFKHDRKWIDVKEREIKDEIKELQSQIKIIINQTTDIDSKPILNDMYSFFLTKISHPLKRLDKFMDQMREKLQISEISQLKDDMDNALLKAQKKLTNFAHKVDLNVLSRIRRRDFLSAAKYLKNRPKDLRNLLKEQNKKILRDMKTFASESAQFKIRYSAQFKTMWDQLKEEFLEMTVHTQQIALRTEIILQFTRFSLKSFKHNFVPLNYFTENLSIKHKHVSHTLMSLITDRSLPGKLDLTHDIYFEGVEKIDSKMIATLDIIQKTNVKTYLFLQRIKNVFGILGPILASIGSLLSILYYATRFSSSLFLILSSLLLFVALFLFIWLRKGKERLKE
jgi:hypothetical protein